MYSNFEDREKNWKINVNFLIRENYNANMEKLILPSFISRTAIINLGDNYRPAKNLTFFWWTIVIL